MAVGHYKIGLDSSDAKQRILCVTEFTRSLQVHTEACIV
jgi:hypothetical protein